MDYSEIKANLLNSGTLFRDESFPANNRALCIEHRHEGITWKRPGMIVRGDQKPRFVVNKASRFDFDQGALGDCWFIAAAATLASSHWESFVRVVPPDQSFDRDYTGIFRFRFWFYGKWKEVIIDDYLPCGEGGLLYCRNVEEPNEFWAALLEKAYAKFYGSYENLKGGYIHYALVDLTGGISEVMKIEPYIRAPYRLYEILSRTHEMNSFIGAAIFKPRESGAGEIECHNGLYQGHAYSVTGFQTLNFQQRTVHLVRVRNPWGRGEWNGQWSDRWIRMTHLSSEQKQRLGPDVRRDGEFWISIEDFVKNFHQVQMCHLGPDSMTSEVKEDMKHDHWNMSSFHGSWGQYDAPVSTSCCLCEEEVTQYENPQYYVKLTEEERVGGCTVVVSLMEKEARKSNDPEVFINFYVFKLANESSQRLSKRGRRRNGARLVGRGSKQFIFFKEVSRRFTFSPGFYAIVPETYRSDAEADFYLRIFTKGKAVCGELKD